MAVVDGLVVPTLEDELDMLEGGWEIDKSQLKMGIGVGVSDDDNR